MKFDLEDSIALLERTPRVLDALLRDLPENWTATNEGEGTWSAFDVVGHLIHGDHSDWVPRARRILDDGESRAFEPFDREGHARAMAGKTLPMLLDEFARLRAEKIAELRAMRLQDADFERRGRHPALDTVTLAQLLATWVTRAPVPGFRGSLERLPRGVALRRAQRELTSGMNPAPAFSRLIT